MTVLFLLSSQRRRGGSFVEVVARSTSHPTASRRTQSRTVPTFPIAFVNPLPSGLSSSSSLRRTNHNERPRRQQQNGTRMGQQPWTTTTTTTALHRMSLNNFLPTTRVSTSAGCVRTGSKLFSSSVDSEDELLMQTGYRRPTVQWYPGHIAKAERQLAETLKAVDVVVEVRDARACKATAHPRVGEWCAGRPRIVVLTHLDLIPKSAASSWKRAYESLGAECWDDAPVNTQVANQARQAREVRFQYKTAYGDSSTNKKGKSGNNNANKGNTSIITPVEQVMFVNARQGQGIHALHRAIFKAGAHVQERRDRRGLKSRALRVGIIGYPNVGKVRVFCVALIFL